MRRHTLLLLLVLLILSGSFFAKSARQYSEHDIKIAQTSLESSDSPDVETKQALINSEHQLWRAMRLKDLACLNRLVADDARFVGENNTISKPEFAQYISSYSPSDYSLTDIKAHMTDQRSGLVRYKVVAKFTFNDELELPASTAQVSSRWVNKNKKWQLSHHHVSLMPSAK